MIKLSNDQERKEIEAAYNRFLSSKDVAELARFGIKIEGKSQSDCFADACVSLGLQSFKGLDLLGIIENPENEIEFPEKRRPKERVIAFYDDSGRFTNAALLRGCQYSSVWDELYKVCHGLDKVPYDFGNRVRFYRVGDNVRARVAEALREGPQSGY